jgi:TatD DNase family protein
MFVDSHCHIDGPDYDADRDDVIARAREAGVTTMLNVGTGDPHSGVFERAVALAEQHREVYCATGVHPHDAKLFDEAAERRLIDLAKQCSRVIAWGEIGLDYHYDHSPRDVQRDVFRRQLAIARELNLPVVIHSRAADEDTIAILRQELPGKSGTGVTPVSHAQDARATTAGAGVMHCFGGGLQMAEQAIDLGFFISFAGNLTFKKADDLRAIARKLPLERLLVETDCPYLTPVPFRGKRNEPARVVETAKFLSELKDVTLEEVGRATTDNFAKLFGVR